MHTVLAHKRPMEVDYWSISKKWTAGKTPLDMGAQPTHRNRLPFTSPTYDNYVVSKPQGDLAHEAHPHSWRGTSSCHIHKEHHLLVLQGSICKKLPIIYGCRLTHSSIKAIPLDYIKNWVDQRINVCVSWVLGKRWGGLGEK